MEQSAGLRSQMRVRLMWPWSWPKPQWPAGPVGRVARQPGVDSISNWSSILEYWRPTFECRSLFAWTVFETDGLSTGSMKLPDMQESGRLLLGPWSLKKKKKTGSVVLFYGPWPPSLYSKKTWWSLYSVFAPPPNCQIPTAPTSQNMRLVNLKLLTHLLAYNMVTTSVFLFLS